MGGGIGGILDFSTSSEAYTSISTVTNTDSNNRSSSKSSVLDNVGNLSVSFGGGTIESTVQRLIPWAAAGLGAVLLFRLMKR